MSTNDDHRYVPALDGPASCTGCGWESRRTGIASITQHDAHLEDVARKTAAPITADERAAVRKHAEVGHSLWPGEVLRLLDALDTAEANRDEARAELAIARQHQREAAAGSDLTILRQRERLRSREEQVRRLRAEVPRLHALVADLRAATSPAWDEDAVREAGVQALTAVYERYGDDYLPDEAEMVDVVLDVVRRHLPVRPDRETIARAFFDAGANAAAEEFGLDEPVSWDSLKDTDVVRLLAQADAVLDLWPGESRATVQAEALREFADTRGVNVGDDDDEWWRGYRQAQRECLHDASARADRIEGAP